MPAARRHRPRVPVPFLIAAVAYLWWLSIVPPVATGDEPHYIAVADSITDDADLDLTNQYEQASLEPGDQAFKPVGSGVLRSIRQPGLPILLAPVRLLTDELTPLRWLMILIAATLAHQTYRLADDLALGERRGLVNLAWAGTFLTVPAISFSNQVYPEVPGALACVIAGRLLIRSPQHPKRAMAAVAVLSVLPFLIIRFLPLAVGLVAIITTPPRDQHERPEPRPRPWTTGAMPARVKVAAPLVVGMATLAALLTNLYGSPLPTASYPTGTTTAPSLFASYQFGVGSLLSDSGGLIPYSPFLWIGVVGAIALAARFGRVGWLLLGLALVHALVVNPQGFFGYALPGRFLIVFLPLLAFGGMAAMAASRTLATLGVVLLAVSGWIVIQSAERYPMLLDRGNPQLPLLSRTAMVFPEFNDQPGLDEFFIDLPGKTDDVGSVTSRTVEIRPGPYRVAVIRTSGGPENHPTATVRIVDHRNDGTLAEGMLRATDATQGDELDLSFQVTELTEIVLEVTASQPGHPPNSRHPLAPASVPPGQHRSASERIPSPMVRGSGVLPGSLLFGHRTHCGSLLSRTSHPLVRPAVRLRVPFRVIGLQLVDDHARFFDDGGYVEDELAAASDPLLHPVEPILPAANALIRRRGAAVFGEVQGAART